MFNLSITLRLCSPLKQGPALFVPSPAPAVACGFFCIPPYRKTPQAPKQFTMARRKRLQCHSFPGSGACSEAPD